MNKLSIVLLAFNKYNFTKSCLNDLFKLPEDHEIIVVDNASSDETEAELRKITNSNFKYIRNDENLGFAKGCNVGYAWTSSDNILFLNNDIRVKSDHDTWTQLLLDKIQDDVLVGPTAGYVDPKNNFQFCYETSDAKKPINYMSGWCLAANRQTFDRLAVPRTDLPVIYDHEPLKQIFSEEFGLAYFEDTDLSFRATRLGMKFELVDIPVVHFGKVSSGQINTALLYTKAKQIFNNKWKSK